MLTPRRVTYASAQDNIPASVVTAAETWRQLKDEHPNIGAKAAGMKVFIKEGSVEVTRDGQYLPTGDFTMYFLIEKNKSGNEVEIAIEEFILTVVNPALDEAVK